jgi:hypothetical protein
MANAVLFVGWGETKTGREGQALELFAHSLNFWTRMQSEKKIESFEPVFLLPHGGDLGGFLLIRGEQAKLDAIRHSDEYYDIEMRGLHCLDHMGVVAGVINEGIPKLMQMWQRSMPAR